MIIKLKGKLMHKILDIDKIWAYLITALMGFFEPIEILILWMLIFIVSDMITGIHASLSEGGHIQSCKLQKTVHKFVLYTLTIILLEGLDKYLFDLMDLHLANIGATIICGIELYSILENCYRVTGNVVFKVLTQFTLKKIGEKTNVELDSKLIQKKGKS